LLDDIGDRDGGSDSFKILVHDRHGREVTRGVSQPAGRFRLVGQLDAVEAASLLQ
jgi:hypothetical protein